MNNNSVRKTDLSLLPEVFKEAVIVQKEWELLGTKRNSYLLAIRNVIYSEKERIAIEISKVTGKTIVNSLLEISGVICTINHLVKKAHVILKDEYVEGALPLLYNKRNIKTYSPAGIIGIISPFNWPFMLSFTEIAMALISGNAVMLIMSDISLSIGIIIEEIMEKAGLPKGLFNHIIGNGAEILDVWLDNGIQRICFTGSKEVGKEIASKCGERLIHCSMELGGNDGMIVLEDADLERTTNGALFCGLVSNGQTCCSVERIYCHAKIYDEFLELLKSKIEKLRFGDPIKHMHEVDVGGFATEKQLNVVKRQIQDAIKGGAKIFAKGKPITEDTLSNGNFYPPTILVDVNHDMEVMKEETFGPIIPVFKVKNEEEALKYVNDDQYGLSSSIWTNSNKRGLSLARKIKTGCVSINDHCNIVNEISLEWGGVKNSGMNKTHGTDGLRSMCDLKIINYDLYPNIINQKNIYWYPHSNKKMYELFGDINEMMVSTNVIKKGYLVLKNVPFIYQKITNEEGRKILKKVSLYSAGIAAFVTLSSSYLAFKYWKKKH